MDVERRLVERVVGVEDEGLIVLRSVLVEEVLREEGEVLRLPDVGDTAKGERNVGRSAPKGEGSSATA